MSNKDLGNWGENLAIKFLKKRGYKILAQNYRNRDGEIDIIAKKNSIIYFVEVKTRSSTFFGWPEEAIGEKKKEKIEYLANCYLEENNLSNDYKFGAISILVNKKNKTAKIKYFENI